MTRDLHHGPMPPAAFGEGFLTRHAYFDGRDEAELVFATGRYATLGRLAVEAWQVSPDDGSLEPYAVVTVNLWEPIDGEDCAYLDTNNHPDLVRWMIDEGLVSLVPRVAESGMCRYPEGRFATEFLSSCLDIEHEERREGPRLAR